MGSVWSPGRWSYFLMSFNDWLMVYACTIWVLSFFSIAVLKLPFLSFIPSIDLIRCAAILFISDVNFSASHWLSLSSHLGSYLLAKVKNFDATHIYHQTLQNSMILNYSDILWVGFNFCFCFLASITASLGLTIAPISNLNLKLKCTLHPTIVAEIDWMSVLGRANNVGYDSESDSYIVI